MNSRRKPIGTSRAHKRRCCHGLVDGMGGKGFCIEDELVVREEESGKNLWLIFTLYLGGKRESQIKMA